MRRGPWLFTVVGLLCALPLMACGGPDDSNVAHNWSYQEISFDYPGSLSPGSLKLATAAAQTGCICHTVLPPSQSTLTEVHSEEFRYKGDSHSGVAIKVVDTPNDEATLESASSGGISTETANLLASQLGLPADPLSSAPYAPKATQVGGRAAASLSVEKVTSESGPDVSQETWLIPGSQPHRLYVLTCQAANGHRNGLKTACQAVLDTFRIGSETPSST